MIIVWLTFNVHSLWRSSFFISSFLFFPRLTYLLFTITFVVRSHAKQTWRLVCKQKSHQSFLPLTFRLVNSISFPFRHHYFHIFFNFDFTCLSSANRIILVLSLLSLLFNLEEKRKQNYNTSLKVLFCALVACSSFFIRNTFIKIK